MPAALGLEFHRNVLGPSLVNGLAQAGLYGLIAVALVLTFRVSRTVAFLHGGLVLISSSGFVESMEGTQVPWSFVTNWAWTTSAARHTVSRLRALRQRRLL